MSTQQNKNKRQLFGLLRFIPIMALAFYLLTAISIGPLIIDEIGEDSTKAVIIVITVSLTIACTLLIRKENLTGRENPTFRKYGSISLSLLSLAMTPYGYAGMFVRKGEPHVIQKILGGSVCLVAGIYFMFVFFNCRKK